MRGSLSGKSRKVSKVLSIFFFNLYIDSDKFSLQPNGRVGHFLVEESVLLNCPISRYIPTFGLDPNTTDTLQNDIVGEKVTVHISPKSFTKKNIISKILSTNLFGILLFSFNVLNFFFFRGLTFQNFELFCFNNSKYNNHFKCAR